MVHFSKKDIAAIRAKGMTPEQVLSQIGIFKKGMKYAKLNRPCTPGDGIRRVSSSEAPRLIRSFDQAQRNGRVLKFVPASGAATRMFQTLQSIDQRYPYIDRSYIAKMATNEDVHRQFERFLDHIEKFPFYETLYRVILQKEKATPEVLIAQNKIKEVLRYLFGKDGLNYASAPKGLIPFHRYEHKTRTAFDEHLVEARDYARDRNGNCRIHFTVSKEHRPDIRNYLRRAASQYVFGNTRFHIGYSVQSASTDTIAVDHDNRPFRDPAGNIIFRPGGHGALLHNLNSLKADLVFIKNIDNVVPDRLKGETVKWKRILGGYLIELQSRIFFLLKILKQKPVPESELKAMFDFAAKELNGNSWISARHLSKEKKILYLKSLFDRPIRVCGMVKNEGEPGGGPFWVEERNGTLSLQIVEFSQVNVNSGDQMKIWESSTHFNPVDIVCGLRNDDGRSYDLNQFADPETAFISVKSKYGVELKALEHPGLWNGAMARWNTVFIEVPAMTFNPVKTVFDFLRPEHQP